MNTNMNKLEEFLFQTMRERKKEDINPDVAIKNRLDEALSIKRGRKSVFSLRIPLYQSAAVAAVFFVLGYGAGFLRPAAPSENTRSTTEVVRYVDRPVTEVRYVEVPATQKNAVRDTSITQLVAQNKNLSISLKDDTITQKMLVTMY